MDQAQVRCRSCGRSWPVRDGIPRYFQPDYYWGEVTQTEASQFLREAQEAGWRDAVRKRFPQNQDMQLSLIDWQRASWLPLLGLNPDAVALDVGSGYGAITHAVSHGVGELYSLEAMTERVEFTRIRLEQEGIHNVRLVQASALEPPFSENSFDLIIVNGVLEWVGEWTQSGNPRDVQIHFLSQLHGLLKPSGILLIGIENRFGYGLLRGAMDHSGLPYTSLMPRPLATWYLRHSHRSHHRTVLNPKREYRTYTYSESGYRQLLNESGFQPLSFYWADPGYNQPYTLIPLQDAFPERHFQNKFTDTSQATRGNWRGELKSLLGRSGVLSFFIPEFVIFSRKTSDAGGTPPDFFWGQLRTSLPDLPRLVAPVFALSTHPFGSRNLIRVSEQGDPAPRCIVKTSTSSPGSVENLVTEYQILSLASDRRNRHSNPGFDLPRPLGSLQIGRHHYTAESVAAGTELSRLILTQPRDRRLGLLQKELHRCVEAAIQIACMLQDENVIPAVADGWWQIPLEVNSNRELHQLAVESGFSLEAAKPYTGSVQHGDFTVENIFLPSFGAELQIIDWEHLCRGLPPLYDVFSLLISALPAVSEQPQDSLSGDSPWVAHLQPAFFGNGPWAQLYGETLTSACQALGVTSADAWRQFVHFLLLRLRYLNSRNSPFAQEHLKLMVLTAEFKSRFLLGAR
ncbi:MAG TPA: methyltransferase domain-containing protein [Acidobacteriota bacterium]